MSKAVLNKFWNPESKHIQIFAFPKIFFEGCFVKLDCLNNSLKDEQFVNSHLNPNPHKPNTNHRSEHPFNHNNIYNYSSHYNK